MKGVSGVTKDELEQLISLRAEIREINADIRAISERNTEVVQDKVQASSKDWPYIQGSRVISGIDTKGAKKRKADINRKLVILEARKKEAEDLELRITEYINSIHNSEIRRIFDMRYVKGKNWEEIGKALNCDRTTAEKKVKKYLRNHPERKG